MGYLKGRYSCTITQLGSYWWTSLKDTRSRHFVTLVTEGFPTDDVANSLPSCFGLTSAAYTAAKNAIIDAQLSVIRARTTVDDADIASMMADGQVEGQWGSDAVLDHMPAETFDQLYSAATHDGTVNAAMHEEFEARGLDTTFIPARPHVEYEEMAERVRSVMDNDARKTRRSEITNPLHTAEQARRNVEASKLADMLKDRPIIDEAPPKDDTVTKAYGAIGKSQAGRASIKKSHRGEGENFID